MDPNLALCSMLLCSMYTCSFSSFMALCCVEYECTNCFFFPYILFHWVCHVRYKCLLHAIVDCFPLYLVTGSTTAFSSSADNTALLGWKPSLLLLQRSVVPRVSANWKALGLNLDIQDRCLSAIEKSKPHQPDACCTEMFSMWLGRAPHTGDLPLTWSSVLSAVGKVDSATSEELLAELKSRAKAHPVC